MSCEPRSNLRRRGESGGIHRSPNPSPGPMHFRLSRMECGVFRRSSFRPFDGTSLLVLLALQNNVTFLIDPSWPKFNILMALAKLAVGTRSLFRTDPNPASHLDANDAPYSDRPPGWILFRGRPG